MQCPCGSSTRYHRHEVHSLQTAKEWYVDVTADDIPIIVCREVCVACGREMLREYETPTADNIPFRPTITLK